MRAVVAVHGATKLLRQIPSSLSNLQRLEGLDLRENQSSGEIPSEVWDMIERGVAIQVHGNQFPCLTGGLRYLRIEQRANC